MRCKHKQDDFTWFRDGEAYSRHCRGCGERLSLGLSNDVGCEVEIRAAEIAIHVNGSYVPTAQDNGYQFGWWRHLDMSRGLPDAGDAYYACHPMWELGWLAREISSHDDRETRDAIAWTWDITRPLSEQGPHNR